MAATGRQLKQSVNVFHSLMLYRLLPERGNRGHTHKQWMTEYSKWQNKPNYTSKRQFPECRLSATRHLRLHSINARYTCMFKTESKPYNNKKYEYSYADEDKMYIYVYDYMSVSGELTFIIKAIYPVDGGTLVITSQKKEILGVLDLIGQQQTDCL